VIVSSCVVRDAYCDGGEWQHATRNTHDAIRN
jgi:hypothetical protein